jgi:hypothetical protein
VTHACFVRALIKRACAVVVCLTQFEVGRACAYFPDVTLTQRYGSVRCSCVLALVLTVVVRADSRAHAVGHALQS